MNVIAVVVTYNRKDLLVECLEAILKQSLKPSKIILIDNNSTDGTNELLKQRGFMDDESIEYVLLSKNIGGAGGFYEGMKIANRYNPDYIWIMDDDTIPKEEALKECEKAINKLEEPFSFLASMVYGLNGEFMNVPKINNSKAENGYEYWHKYLDKGLVSLKSATFVSLLINNKAIEKVGLPCKDYFIWGDDTEYTMRLTKYFGPAYLVGGSEVIHKRIGGENISIIKEENKNRINLYYYYYRNKLINNNEYFGRKTFMKQFLVIGRDIVKIVFSKEKYKLLKIKTIIRAVCSYLLKQYDYRAFKNRMNTYID